MSFRAWTGAVLTAGLVTAACLLAEPPPPKTEPDPGDAVLLVCFTDQRPVLVRLRILLEGKVLAERWEEYQKALFLHLDTDGDGKLTEAEARRSPLPEQIGKQLAGNFQVRSGAPGVRFTDLDANHKGKIGFAEFAAYYRREGASPLSVTADPPAADHRVLHAALFQHLDRNGDGKLSREELRQASDLIRKLDSDDDDYLSAEEITAGRASEAERRRERSAEVDARPVFLVVPQGDLRAARALREQLLARYDRDKNGKLSRAEVGLSRDLFESLDADRSGDLDTAELMSFPGLPADGDFTVYLGRTGKEENKIVRREGGKEAEVCRTILSGVLFDLRCVNGQSALAGMRQLALQQFHTADRDRKGRLLPEQVEKPSFRLLQSLFPAADRDGDGSLTEKELNDYFDVYDKGAAAAVTLAVAGERASLFDLLDADGDGRLGYRDLRSAWERLAPFDRNHDGAIAPEEFPYHFRLVLSRGKPRASAGMDNGREKSLRSGPVGPVWFQHMDRNGDGFVSPWEFPGTPEDFRRLDLDGDGLISVEEAEKADAGFRKRHEPKGEPGA